MLLLLLGGTAKRTHPLLARPPTSRRYGTLPGFVQARAKNSWNPPQTPVPEFAWWFWHPRSPVHGSVLCLCPQWAFVWRMMTSVLWSGYASVIHYVLPISVVTAECWCINSTRGLHCPFSSGHHSHHAALNDIIKSGS